MATNYYRHKVTISGEANGHLYYTSTNSGTVQGATTPIDWYNNVYKKDGFVSFPGVFEGSYASGNGSTTILKVVCGVNSETGVSFGGLCIKEDASTSESAFLMSGFDSVVTDELVD